jgi:predicted nuclease of predicted toxin-antitoxin system
MLKFKIDENMPAEAADVLAAGGHDAMTVPQERMGGQPDPNIAAICQQEVRAIVTLDLDFADIRAYAPADYPGIVVLRLFRQDKIRILAAIQRLLPLLGKERLAGKLWIVEDANVRIRG